MIKKNFEIYRGDPKELIFYAPGNISAQKIIFVVKADKVLTSNRLIEKKNTLAGGNDNQLMATYANGKTRITIKLLKEDTQDFTAETYYHDTTAQPTDNSTDPVTISGGELTIDQDVQTPFDGTNLPATAERYLSVLASQLTAGKLVKVGTNDYIDSTNTDAEIASAVLLKHDVNAENTSHYTKSANDVLLAAKVDKVTGKQLSTEDFTTAQKNSVAEYNELFDFLLNGNLDEMNTSLNIDLNKSLIRIGVL